MRNDFHDDDAKTIWQNQSTEAARVSLVLIRQKARQLQARRFHQRVDSLVVPLVIVFFYVFCMKQFAPLRPLLHSLFAFALAWSLAGLCFLHRGARPGGIPGDAGFSTGLEFCRREIERQREVSRRLLLWSFGPVVLAFGSILVAIAMVAGVGIFSKAAPLMTLMVVWMAAYLVIRVGQQRKLQREIDELRQIESANDL